MATKFEFHRRIIIALLCLLACVRLSGSGGSGKHPGVDSILVSYFMEGRFSGHIIVSDSSGLIYNGSYAFADIEAEKSLRLNSVYCLASVSKVITSTAVLKLFEEGRLSLNDLVRDYLPALPACYQSVEIRHLLTHSSGITDFHKQPVFEVSNSDIFNFLVRQDSLEFAPGSRYSYSNSGFILLAMIVEKVSGMSFPAYLEKEFFRPLKMRSTFVNRTGPKSRIVKSYHASGKIDDRQNYFYGSGGIFTTAEDLLKWDRAFFGAQLISRELLSEVLEPQRLNDGTTTSYGLGWGVVRLNGQTIAGHTGGNYGFRIIYEHNLSSGITLIMLTNIGDKCPLMEIRAKILEVL